MGMDDSAVPLTLAFEDVRELQLQWAVIETGSLFVPTARPLASELWVRLTVTVAGGGTATVEAQVDFNDVDSFGHPGSVMKLASPAIAALKRCTTSLRCRRPRRRRRRFRRSRLHRRTLLRRRRPRGPLR